MARPTKEKCDNRALLTHLDLRRPEDMTVAEWLRAANVNSSFITDLRKGTEPSIYKIERLAREAGLRLSEFWRGVEKIQFEMERRKADEKEEAGENVKSVGPGQRAVVNATRRKRLSDAA